VSGMLLGGMGRARPPSEREAGFTLVELMVVVLIIGILVSIAIPVFNSVKARAQQRTCFGNQRSIMSAVAIWRVDSDRPYSDVAGRVDMSNPIMTPMNLLRPPRCPTAPAPVNRDYPTVAEGAYTLDTSGNVEACTLGAPTAHGSFMTP
jgi:prepilin-type N-terminal cleavage/methylation domain-containing protein